MTLLNWIGKLLSENFADELIAVYAGSDKSGIYFNQEWRSVERNEIKHQVKERVIRLVCATDAASEGLNLQTLGTLVNIDSTMESL